MSSSRNFATPNFLAAIAKKKPETISPIPQTESWLLKKFRLIAEGTPSTKLPMAIERTALCRVIPKSMKIRTPSSSIAIIDENAATTRARKNSVMKNWPPIIWLNNVGTQMKLSPVLAGPLSVRAAWASANGRTANTVGMMASAASIEAELLPNPIVIAVPTMSSFLREYTAYVTIRPQPAPVDHADCVSACSQIS